MQISLMPDYSLLAVMVIFIAEYFVVKKFFLEPINNVLEEREGESRTSQEQYESSLARFREATAEIERRLHDTRRDASQLRDKFRSEAAAHRSGLIERTTAEAKKIVNEAEARLKRDVDETRAKLGRDAESLARIAAERILGRSV
ncbi:MAG TPA: ATP synthase F0 subunit B [Thermoanaerobaculia bacterium]|nr:ATP synthase F0 subunit B [Thermoanaerobaculia bacterium]